jgi:hypothetical protein
VIAYKFLREGAIGPFSGVAWPKPEGGRPGAWLEVDGPLDACANGVHACPVEALACWFVDELWTAELDGELLSEGSVLVARRGRLLEPITRWPAVAPAFAAECSERARERAADHPGDARLVEFAGDAESHAAQAADPQQAILAAYCAAVAADILQPGGFGSERAWQSKLLAAHLDL